MVNWMRVVRGAVGVSIALCGGCSGGELGSSELLGEDSQAITFPARSCEPNCSTWVYPALNWGDLVYVPDQEGDRIADFSHVGYKRGANSLPSDTAPPQTQAGFEDAALTVGNINWGNSPPPPTTLTASTICNGTFDHTAAIQRLLGGVGDRTPDPVTGVRGRVWLPRAHFAIWATLHVPDGVVLRGHSAHPSGSSPATTLHGCGPDVPEIIRVGRDGNNGALDPEVWDILDDNVPSGGNMLRVREEAIHAVDPGDRIRITRTPCGDSTCPGLVQWRQDIGQPAAWEPEQIHFERFVTSIQRGTSKNGDSGGLIFFDPPITTALEGKYGPHIMRRYSRAPSRTRNVGIHKLRGVSGYSFPSTCTEATPCPSLSFVGVWYAEDVWINDIVAEQFSKAAVTMHEAARWTTVDGAEYVHAATPAVTDNGGYRYPFFNMGSMNLVVNTTATHGRHAYMVHQWMSGPNAFVNGTAHQTHQDSGTHGGWSTGALFDTINIVSSGHSNHITDGQLNSENRGAAGTSQGWAGSSIVAWNSHAVNGFKFYNPIVNAASYVTGDPAPTGSGQSWLIGATVPSGRTLLHAPVASENEAVPHLDHYATTPTNAQTGLLLGGAGIGSSLFRTSHEFYRHQRIGAPGDPDAAGFEVRHYVVGDPDNFTLEEPPNEDIYNDSVYVSHTFWTWLVNTTGLTERRGFDYFESSSRHIPFTIRYDLKPTERVRFAYLAVRMRRNGAWTRDADHYVQFAGAATGPSGIAATAKTYYWRDVDGTIPNGAEVLPQEMAGPLGWSSGNGATVRVLEFPEEIFGTMLNQTLGSSPRYGEFHANFARKTRIDWAILTLVIDR